jgi:hypothetical protein
VYVAAVRRPREIVEPEIDKRDSHKLPLPEAGDEARDLVALSSLATCHYEFRILTRPVPAYITHFDKATLKLSEEDGGGGRNTVRFEIRATNAQGRAVGVAGDVTFPPPELSQ